MTQNSTCNTKTGGAIDEKTCPVTEGRRLNLITHYLNSNKKQRGDIFIKTTLITDTKKQSYSGANNIIKQNNYGMKVCQVEAGLQIEGKVININQHQTQSSFMCSRTISSQKVSHYPEEELVTVQPEVPGPLGEAPDQRLKVLGRPGESGGVRNH